MSKILGISVFLLIIIIIILLVVLLSYLSFKFFKKSRFLKYFFISFLAGGLISFLATHFFWVDAPKFIHEIGFAWLIFMPFYLLSFLFTYLSKLFTRNNKVINSVFYLSLSLSVIVLLIGRYNYNDIKATNYKFDIKNFAGNNLRIALATDLHLGNYIDTSDLERIISKINAQNPDVVILGGDVIDREIMPLEDQKMYELFKTIRAPKGVYAVLGNHERYGKQSIDRIKEFYAKSDIHLLIDSVATLSDVVIVGRDDISRDQKRADILHLIKDTNISKDLPLVVVSHKPLSFGQVEDFGKADNSIKLYLSGHTHYGQIYPFSKIVEKQYPHYYGHFIDDNINFITSSGASLWGPKVRLGTKSEIVVIDLVGEGSYVIPARDSLSATGSEFIKQVEMLPLVDREERVVSEILNGNIPDFLRNFRTISFYNDTNYVEIEILTDYLSIGSDEDFIRMPMTPVAAQIIADSLHCSMPTAYLVNEIAKNADGAIEPFPFRPKGNRNELLITFEDNNNAINALMAAGGFKYNQLISGMRKDVIITHKIASDSSRLNHVTIYGWHYPNGKRIQPSNNVHSNDYVDYSHGIRLVKRSVKINGKYYDIEDVLTDPQMYHILSDEDQPMIKASYRGDILHDRPLGT